MKTSTITEFDEDLERLIEDMLETMYEAPGVGLAAPQIGVAKRLFVADIGEGPFEMVNPTIITAEGKWKFEEGCLSIPGKYWTIKRFDYVVVEGVDRKGEPVVHDGDDLMGRVLQHEIDHLDGLLLLARLGSRVKKQALKELREESLGIGRSL